MNDAVNHPSHYNSNPSGVECITVVEHMNFNVGNAVKYLWRAGLKKWKPPENTSYSADQREQLRRHVEDLQKAAWYINREIERLDKSAGQS